MTASTGDDRRSIHTLTIGKASTPRLIQLGWLIVGALASLAMTLSLLIARDATHNANADRDDARAALEANTQRSACLSRLGTAATILTLRIQLAQVRFEIAPPGERGTALSLLTDLARQQDEALAARERAAAAVQRGELPAECTQGDLPTGPR